MFACSVALLVLNDHVLKSRWPGPVTGKLSDVAGVTMIAIVLAALSRRVDVAIAVTALAFGLLKTVPAAAHRAAPVLGGTTLTDRTDLLALLVLVPLAWWLRTESTERVHRSVPTLFTAQAVLVGAAVFATTATSCDVKGVGSIYNYDGALLAYSDGTLRSDDGGLTWTRWPGNVDIDPERLSGQDKTCFETVCIEVDGVQQTLVETKGRVTTTILALDDKARKEIERLGNPDCIPRTFRSLAKIDVDRQPHVVVSMGPAGSLHRAPDGTWTWVSVGQWHVKPGADGLYLGIPVAP